MSGTFIVYFTNALVYCYESYEYYRTTCGKEKKNGTQIEDSLIINHSKLELSEQATGHICTHVSVNNFWTVRSKSKIQ